MLAAGHAAHVHAVVGKAAVAAVAKLRLGYLRRVGDHVERLHGERSVGQLQERERLVGLGPPAAVEEEYVLAPIAVEVGHHGVGHAVVLAYPVKGLYAVRARGARGIAIGHGPANPIAAVIAARGGRVIYRIQHIGPAIGIEIGNEERG